MVTLLLSVSNVINISEILGYILTACEILLVIILILQKFVPADTKFGVFLSRIFKGIKLLKKDIQDDGKINNSEKEDNDNGR